MLKEMMWKVSGDLDNIRAVIKPFLDEALNPFRNHTLRISRDNSMLPIRGINIFKFFCPWSKTVITVFNACKANFCEKTTLTRKANIHQDEIVNFFR